MQERLYDPTTYEEESAIYDHILEMESMAASLMDVGSYDDYFTDGVRPAALLRGDGR